MSPPFVPFRGRISRLLAPAREDDDAGREIEGKRERERKIDRVGVERGGVQTRVKGIPERVRDGLKSDGTSRFCNFFPSIVPRECAILKSERVASLIKFGVQVRRH